MNILTALLLLLLIPGHLAAQARPDIVLVVFDDARADDLQYMPITVARVKTYGTYYDNFYSNVSLCAPARASLLSGQYSRCHGVRNNGGAFKVFDWSNTLATWLEAAGYRNGLFGKASNTYDTVAPYIPPGFASWFALVGGNFYVDPMLVESDGAVHSYLGRYATDVLADKVVEFIQGADLLHPLYIHFSPYAPHSPSTPNAEDVGTLAATSFEAGLSANYDEEDVSDKPKWVQLLPRLSNDQKFNYPRRNRKRRESLQAVDRAIGRTLDALALRGQPFYLFVLSDNGFSLGAHRWEKKLCFYDECARLPLLIMGPGVEQGAVRQAIASNVDIAPTIAAIAGAVPQREVNGTSLIPTFATEPPIWRDAVLLENRVGSNRRKGFCAVTATHAYCEYDNGNRELYDKAADPEQLVNVVGNPGNASLVSMLRTQLAALKAEGSCPN